MKFSHTFAVHSCFTCRGYSHTSLGAPNWSGPFILLAVILALPLWAFLTLFRRWPWYAGAEIVATELLLFFASGMIASTAMFRGPPRVCPQCGAPLLLAGRYVKKSAAPNLADKVFFVLLAVANVAIWLCVLRQRR
jgi:hypothetical protein